MTDLILERHYNTDPDTLFAYLTDSQYFHHWWGPEGATIDPSNLAFGGSGPWVVILHGTESGQVNKVSGHVLRYDPPRFIRFSWAWHDDQDVRGHESIVSYTVEADGQGSKLTLRHTGLEDEASITNHEGGWSSALTKLERHFAP